MQCESGNKDILEFNFFGVNKQWMKGRLLILLGLALFFALFGTNALFDPPLSFQPDHLFCVATRARIHPPVGGRYPTFQIYNLMHCFTELSLVVLSPLSPAFYH